MQNDMALPQGQFSPLQPSGFPRMNSGDFSVDLATLSNMPSHIPTPPPSANGSTSPMNTTSHPSQDHPRRPSFQPPQNPMLVNTEVHTRPIPAPIAQQQHGGHQHIVQGQYRYQVQQQQQQQQQLLPQQQQQAQYYPNPSHLTRQPQVIQQGGPSRIVPSATTIPQPSNIPHQQQQPYPMLPNQPKLANPNRPPNPTGPAPQARPPIPSSIVDPPVATFNMMRPVKDLLEQTWATAVSVVQHELSALSTSHAQLAAENARLQSEYRKLYGHLERSEGERVRLTGQLQVAIGEGNFSRDMLSQVGDFHAAAVKERKGRLQAERQLAEAMAKHKQFIQNCKCGAASAVLTPPEPIPDEVIDLTNLDDPSPNTAPLDPNQLQQQMFSAPTPASNDTPNEHRRERDPDDALGDEDMQRKRRRVSGLEQGADELVASTAPKLESSPESEAKPSAPEDQHAMTNDSSPNPQPAGVKHEAQETPEHQQQIATEVVPPTLSSAHMENDTKGPGLAPSPAPLQGKIGINHIQLVYEEKESLYMCRMCQQRKDADPSVPVASFPLNASFEALIGHCRDHHPAAFDLLKHMSPNDISEMRQRIKSNR
ncbi:hypothetical protein BV25DRAFT_1829139 [Artomyces pyxidatus]|uniref:Uncharacterized protein n=1 Tax=Artomyces pyxidatus TaxID=48021 RepID=A0ACB8SUF1_9AGAM|nr:hypothetical protein BV25DRAFT_1829139 [Artomyces pyxidatus]